VVNKSLDRQASRLHDIEDNSQDIEDNSQDIEDNSQDIEDNSQDIEDNSHGCEMIFLEIERNGTSSVQSDSNSRLMPDRH
jgi:methyl-accepting chemotaxis protein